MSAVMTTPPQQQVAPTSARHLGRSGGGGVNTSAIDTLVGREKKKWRASCLVIDRFAGRVERTAPNFTWDRSMQDKEEIRIASTTSRL